MLKGLPETKSCIYYLKGSYEKCILFDFEHPSRLDGQNVELKLASRKTWIRI